MKTRSDFNAYIRKWYKGDVQKAEKILNILNEEMNSCDLETLMRGWGRGPKYAFESFSRNSCDMFKILTVGQYLLGRLDICNIALQDYTLSRLHCLLTIHADGVIEVRDLCSENGVWVEGCRIPCSKKKRISLCTEITIGRTTVIVSLKPHNL